MSTRASSSTQSSDFETALRHCRNRRSRSSSGIRGSKRTSSCQWARSSSRSRQTPVARPAAYAAPSAVVSTTFGQAAFDAGESKNTYGTGNFLLVNTGTEIIRSGSGLITTVGYRIGDEPARYALEGSIAVTGSLVQWLRDNLGIIQRSEDVETLAATVDDLSLIHI